MTAAEVLDRAITLGVVLDLGPDDEVRYRGERAAVEAIMPDLRANASAIAAVLRERQPVPCAADAVNAAASLLRQGRWALASAPCPFFIGDAAATVGCRRCGTDRATHLAGHNRGRNANASA